MAQNDPWAEFEVVEPAAPAAPAPASPAPSGGFTGFIPGTPKPPKPNYRQLTDEERVARGLPPGVYQLSPEGKVESVPGTQPDKTAVPKPLPSAEAKEFETQITAYADLKRAADSFDDRYSGPGSAFESTMQGWLGTGTPGQRDWWADFRRTDAIFRNALFGASLSESEKKAYEETTVTPNMKPELIRQNINRRLKLAEDVLKRRTEFLRANGYEPAAIEALLGQYAPIVSGPGEVRFNDEMPPESPTRKLTPEQEAAYNALVSSGASADQIRAFGKQIGFDFANADEIVKARDEGLGIKPADEAVYNIPEEIGREKAIVDERLGKGGLQELAVQGMTLGLSDEAAGVGRALSNAITSPFTDAPFDPASAYQVGKGTEQLRIQDARNALGWAAPVVEVGAGMLSGNPTSALRGIASSPSLIGRVAEGARAGAAGGALAGFGYGEGLGGSGLSAVGGAVGGGVLGGAFPIAGRVISDRIGGMRRLFGRDPDIPRRLISEAIEADAATPGAVGAMMDDARTRGSPMMLADTGDNTRALLASVARQPGPAKKLTRTAVIERQKAQFERVADAVRRDLGPTANIREKGEELIEAARAASRPLYEQFEAAPGASSVKLDDLVTRPSFKKALKKAVELAAEESVDPTALGFQFNEAGDVALETVPSWRTLDFVKKALDDVVEGYRDPVTGKLNLTNEARATNGTLRTLVSRMDKVNPFYADARKAYAGPARMRDALQKGNKALSRSPDDILAEMKGMGEPEKEMYRMGLRKAMIDMMAGQRDTADKIARLIGTPKLRTILNRVFGSKAEFDRFVATLQDEDLMQQTYRAVATGSPTAERMAVDATTNDTGLAESAIDAALRGGKDSMWSALVSAFQKLREVDRFGAGEAGQRARESIAALLTETDPTVLKELIAAAQRATQRQAAIRAAEGRRARRIGQLGGQSIGSVLGGAQQPIGLRSQQPIE